MKDALYQTLIYKPFLFNPYFNILPKGEFKGKTFQEFVNKDLPEAEKLSKDNLK